MWLSLLSFGSDLTNGAAKWYNSIYSSCWTNYINGMEVIVSGGAAEWLIYIYPPWWTNYLNGMGVIMPGGAVELDNYIIPTPEPIK